MHVTPPLPLISFTSARVTMDKNKTLPSLSSIMLRFSGMSFGGLLLILYAHMYLTGYE